MTTDISVPGYTYDDPALPPSPVTLADLEKLSASVLFGADDVAALRTAGEVLATQIEDILDVWYGFVGSHPHLLAYFSTPAGDPIPEYLTRVRSRFGQWILDTCNRAFDEQWLAYQHEIALRHTDIKKNQVDHAASVPEIPLRYLIAFIYPITATMRQFLANGGHSDSQVDAMHQAWFKAVTLQIALWAQPYTPSSW